MGSLANVRNIDFPDFPELDDSLPNALEGSFNSVEPFVSADTSGTAHVAWKMPTPGFAFDSIDYTGGTDDLEGWYVYHPTPLTKAFSTSTYFVGAEVSKATFESDFPSGWQLTALYGEVPVYAEYVAPANWEYNEATERFVYDNMAAWYNRKGSPGGSWLADSFVASSMLEASGAPPAKVRTLDPADEDTYGTDRWFFNEAYVTGVYGCSAETHNISTDVYVLYADQKYQGWWESTAGNVDDDVDSNGAITFNRLRVAHVGEGISNVVPFATGTIANGSLDTTRQYGTDWDQIFVCLLYTSDAADE